MVVNFLCSTWTLDFDFLRFPSGCAIGGDDRFAAFKRLGDDESEIVGESRQAKHVAPVPFGFLFRAEFVGDNVEVD